MKRIFVTLCYLMVLVLWGCGGGSTDAPTSQPKAIASVTVTDGDNQSGTVSTGLIAPLVAKIMDSSGQVLPGQVVNFVITQGGGSVFATAVVSDANGTVTNYWTLGTSAGPQKVEVRAIDSHGDPVVFATFTAIANAGAPTSVTVVSGAGQLANQQQALSSPITVMVRDSYGNSVSGATVSFSATDGGSAQPSSVLSDSNGLASAAWTLGTPIGTQTLTAAVDGISPLTITAQATRAPAGSARYIAKVSGDNQTVAQHIILPQPLQVTVTDALGNPVAGVPITFAAATGSAPINPLTVIYPTWGYPNKTVDAVVTDSNGNATWRGYLHASGDQKINALLDESTYVTFNITVNASSHSYDGLYLSPIVTDNPFSVINGVAANGGLTPEHDWFFNEATGVVTWQSGYNVRSYYTGSISTDSNGVTSASGTYETIALSAGTIVGNGTWRYVRQ